MAAALALSLAGCNLFGTSSSKPTPRPSILNPETDAFSSSSVREYEFTESLRRSGDSVLAYAVVRVQRVGDTVIDGSPRPRLHVAGASAASPAPAAVFSRLGFRPSRLVFDGDAVPDPGADLPFPTAPAIGWRLDTSAGEMRFVRQLTRVETLRLLGKDQEHWVFAETTWSDTRLLGHGTTWMGPRGLGRHVSEWPLFSQAQAAPGTLVRRIDLTL
jgi:hypothetical protein